MAAHDQPAGAFHVSAQSFGLTPSLSDPYAMDRIGMVLRNADRVIVSSTAERRAMVGDPQGRQCGRRGD
jgi:hypothetical protein